MTEQSNPYSTGGGGGNFEAKVQAAFVLTMLARGQCPCIPASNVISQIRLQSRQLGFQTDDLLVTTTTSHGVARFLAQIKHQLSFTAGDDQFRATIQNAWKDFNDHSIDPGKDAIAIITGPATRSAIYHARPVFEWARASADEVEFCSKLSTAGFSSKEKEGVVEAIRTILTQAETETPTESRLWNFLKSLHLLTYDFDVANSQDEARSIGVIRLARSPTSIGTPEGIWAELVDFVRTNNQAAGTLIPEKERTTIPANIAHSFAADFTLSAGLDRLCEHSSLNLNLIKTELLPGINIPRYAVIEQALNVIQETGLILLVGEAGSGKSVIAKSLAEILSDKAPVLSFRAEVFDAIHLHSALASIGVAENIASLSARLSLMPNRTIIIDGMERLQEMRYTEAFQQLLDTLIRDGGWKIILTCRSYAASWLSAFLSTSIGVRPTPFEIPLLSAAELAALVPLVPALSSALSDGQLQAVLRIPFYLSIASSIGPQGVASTKGMPADAIKYSLWKAVVSRPSERANGMPARRERQFQKIALARVTRMLPFVDITDPDGPALQALISDGVIEESAQHLYAPAHDLFEDWAIRSHVEKVFYANLDDPTAIFSQLGAEPAVRRAFRQWLPEAVSGPQGTSVKDVVLRALRSSGVPQYWHDDINIGLLMSSVADDAIQAIESYLFDDSKRLLKRLIHILRIACKAPNKQVLKLIGLRGPVSAGLELYLTRPDGPGWGVIIELLERNLSTLLLEDTAEVCGLLEEWSAAINQFGRQLKAEKPALAIAFHFLELLEQDRTIGSYEYLERFQKIVITLCRADTERVSAYIREICDGREVPHQRDFQLTETLLTVQESFPVCVYLPDMILLALNSFRLDFRRPIREQRRKQRRFLDDDIIVSDMSFDHDGHTEFGIDRGISNVRWFPASAYKGPVLSLLRWNQDVAFQPLFEFLERCCESYVKQNRRGDCFDVELTLPGSRKKVISGSLNLWCLYRGTQVSSQFMQSNYMALELWLIERLDRGEDIGPEVKYIFENARSVAPIAVMASIALKYPGSLGEYALSLISSIELFRLDFARFSLDQTHVGDVRGFMGAPTNGPENVYYDERKKSDSLPHRREHLETLAVKLQLSEFQQSAFELVDLLKEQQERDKSSDAAERLVLKRIDLRNWEDKGEAPGGGRYVEAKIDEPELKAVVDEAQENLEELNVWARLQNWAIASFRGEKVPESIQGWRDALSQAQSLHSRLSTSSIAEMEQMGNVVAAVAGAAVCLHLEELTPSEVDWCAGVVFSAVESGWNEGNHIQWLQKHGAHGSRLAAAAVPKLAIHFENTGEHSATLEMLGKCIFHSTREIRAYASYGVRAYIFPKNPSLGWDCFNALMWLANAQASCVEGEREDVDTCMLGAARSAQRIFLEDRRKFQRKEKFSLFDYDDNELMLALTMIPADKVTPAFADILLKILRDLAEATKAHEDERRSRTSARRSRMFYHIGQDYEFRFAFADYYARVMFDTDEPIFINMRGELLKSLEVAPVISDIALQKLISEIDRLDRIESEIHLDRFWSIWLPAARAVFAGRHWSRHSYETMRTLLFCSTPWKETTRSWKPLEFRPEFVKEAFQMAGENRDGFKYLLQMLTKIGQPFLPEVLVDVNKCFERKGPGLISERYAKSDLEEVLRISIIAHSTKIRTTRELREATLNLLTGLIDKGSHVAFYLRERLIAPGRE